MRQCCFVKVEHKNSGSSSNRKSYLQKHFDYLDKDNAKLMSKMTPQDLMDKYPAAKTYYVTISAEDANVDTKFLADTFLNMVMQQNKNKDGKHRKPDYVAFEHNDTAHPHIHMVIPDATHYCTYNLNGKFYLKASEQLSDAITEKYGQRTELQYRADYANGINKECATKIDFDIARIAGRDKELNFNFPKTDDSQFYAKLNNPKIEDWKKNIVIQRLDYLSEIGMAKQTEDGLTLDRNFKVQLLKRGKINQIVEDNRQIEIQNIQFTKSVRDSNIKEIVAQKEERLKVKSLIRTNDGELKYFERMLPKQKRKYDAPDSSKSSNIASMETQKDIILQEQERRLQEEQSMQRERQRQLTYSYGG